MTRWERLLLGCFAVLIITIAVCTTWIVHEMDRHTDDISREIELNH